MTTPAVSDQSRPSTAPAAVAAKTDRTSGQGGWNILRRECTDQVSGGKRYEVAPSTTGVTTLKSGHPPSFKSEPTPSPNPELPPHQENRNKYLVIAFTRVRSSTIQTGPKAAAPTLATSAAWLSLSGRLPNDETCATSASSAATTRSNGTCSTKPVVNQFKPSQSDTND